MSQPGRLPLSNRGGCSYIRRLRCFGNAAGIFAGSRAPPGAARPVEQGQAMDFDLTEEQRLLRDSVDRLLADRYAFEKRKSYLAEPDGWSRGVVVAIRRAGPARAAVCRGTWRVRRRRDRDHAGHGGVRPGAGAGAVSRDGRAGRHRAAPRRQRRAASGAAAADRRGQAGCSPSRMASGRRATICPTC